MLSKITSALKRLFSYRYRSSVTGRFVKSDYAEHNPRTTQKERVE